MPLLLSLHLCRFADCMHLAEPGCAVTAAELERHEHYVKFLAEVKVRWGLLEAVVHQWCAGSTLDNQVYRGEVVAFALHSKKSSLRQRCH